MSVAAALSRFVADAAAAPLDEDTLHHARRALIDWMGATLAGWREPPATILLSALADEIGSGPARIYSLPATSSSARTAALLNGTASHVVEMDDIYAPALYHPGCPTVAAALATCQARGASGAELLRAIAIGYEVGNRIGAAVQPSHYRYWHTTGTVGCFGAAAAAAAAMELGAVQAGHALATVATFAAGLQQAFRTDSMSKPLHAGRAAEAGVFAAQCAARGLHGEAEMFEGPVGFGAAMSERVDWHAMLATLGKPWTITQMTHKDHACCGHAFAAIDGALALRDTAGDPGAIRRIAVETYATAIEVAGVREPTSPFEARFSIPFTVATALIHGRVRLDAFHPDRVADPTIRALAARVKMTASSACDAVYPELRRATLTIETADGRVLRHEQPTRRGSPAFPMSDDDLDAKFLELASPAIGQSAAQSLLERIKRIDGASDVLL